VTRRRFVQIDGELVEVGADYVQPLRTITDSALWGDRHYAGTRTSDGVDISTRTKHREYMRRTGLTTVDDYSGGFKEAERRRIDAKRGVDPSRRQDVAQALAETLSGRGKQPRGEAE